MASSGKSSVKAKLSADQLISLLKNSPIIAGEAQKNFNPIKFLQDQKILSPLIILGPEPIRSQRLIEWLRDSFFKIEKDYVITHYGSQLTSSSLQQLLSSTQNLSLFQKYQLIVIHEADQVKAAITKNLAPALKKTSDSSFTILTASSINQKTTLLNELSSVGTTVEITKLKGNSLNRWIEKEAIRAGSEPGIDPYAAELLAQAYSENISDLPQELAKLSLLTKHGKKISKALVEQILIKTPERTSFELIHQVSKKNLLAALNLLNELLDQGLHPLQLSAFLSRAIRTLLAQKNLPQNYAFELNSELTNPWFKKNLSSTINSFTEEQLTIAIELLKHLDLSLKSNGLPDELALSILVQRLATKQLAS